MFKNIEETSLNSLKSDKKNLNVFLDDKYFFKQ